MKCEISSTYVCHGNTRPPQKSYFCYNQKHDGLESPISILHLHESETSSDAQSQEESSQIESWQVTAVNSYQVRILN